jgi:CRP/FNR family transcriptional regulator, nitrogen fixation regulation protein
MKTQTNSHQALAGHAILARMNSGEPQPQIGSVQHFAQDREILAEGARAEYFYKVVSGVVRTCKFLLDGRRQIDAFHIPGDIFGLEPGGEYRLSAEAVSDCTVIIYRKTKLDNLAADDMALSQELLGFAMKSMARAQEHSLLLGRRSAVEKVAGFLLDWAQKSKDRAMLTLAMTRQDIADYLGLTIETVSRTMTQLQSQGLIELQGCRRVRLARPAALADLCV